MKTTKPQGFALPITLIILSLLAVLSIGLSQMSRQNIAKVKYRQQLLNDELVLKNATQWTLYRLLSGIPFANVVYNDSFSLPVDNTSVNYQQTQVKVQDAAGLMGLYLYQSKRFEQLLRQLTSPNQAAAVTAQLKDWIDKDSLTSYQGMEINDYIDIQQSIRPRNAPIRSLDELLELPAMTNELFNGNGKHVGLKDLLLAGGVTDFNITTAPDVLLVPMLNITKEKSRQIQNLKQARDWQRLRRVIETLNIPSEYSDFQQSYQYLITLSLPHGKRARGLYQLYPDNSPPYKIKQWQYPDNERG